jgi:hypothetical protein
MTISGSGYRVVGQTPLAIITSVPVRLWLRADLAVTIATGVSSWVDQSSNAYAFNQATGGLQPTRNAADAALNNQGTITGDGSDDYLLNSSIVVGATYWRSCVAKVNTWVTNHRMMDQAGGSGRTGYLLAGSSPNCYLWENSSAVFSTGSLAWKRYEDQQSNATTDYIKVGAANATGTALGRTTSATGLTLFAQAGGPLPAACSFAEIIITDGIPTPTEKTNIDTYLSTRYLASLLT